MHARHERQQIAAVLLLRMLGQLRRRCRRG
jgi:hypothetical protein